MANKQQPSDLEEQLDNWFAQRPLAPSKDFTERTIQRIRKQEKQETDPGNIIHFPQWITAFGAIAAILTIGFILNNKYNTPNTSPKIMAQSDAEIIYSDEAYIEMEELLLMNEAFSILAQADTNQEFYY